MEPFKEQYIARSVLKQLIRQNIFITLTMSTMDPEKNYIFKRGTECDYFVLLLEGWFTGVDGSTGKCPTVTADLIDLFAPFD